DTGDHGQAPTLERVVDEKEDDDDHGNVAMQVVLGRPHVTLAEGSAPPDAAGQSVEPQPDEEAHHGALHDPSGSEPQEKDHKAGGECRQVIGEPVHELRMSGPPAYSRCDSSRSGGSFASWSVSRRRIG